MSDLSTLKTDGFWYLASPYTHKSPNVMRERAYSVNDVSGRLIAAGVHVYTTIWATHRIAQYHELPTEFEFWLGFNKAFIDASVGVIVADIDGWKTSRGCKQEIEYAKSCEKPVWLLRMDMTFEAL